MKPRIFIYTQAYNAQKTLARAIESVLAQSFGDYTHFILDNGSNDATREIINWYMKKDKRIFTHSVRSNDLEVSVNVLPLIQAKHPGIKWSATIDADDELKPDFFKETYTFAEKNDLQLVATGYETVDALTGSVISEKRADGDFIISGDAFRTDFIKYRGFTVFYWAKLILSELAAQGLARFKGVPFYNYRDTAYVLTFYSMAQRVGVIGKPLVRYFKTPGSCARIFHQNRVENDWFAFEDNKNYLLNYGGIDKLNMDFLYAIQLSLIKETLDIIYNAAMPFKEKLGHILRVFSHETARDTLKRKADPQFRNLAGRAEFVEGVKDWVRAQDEAVKYGSEIEELFELLRTEAL